MERLTKRIDGKAAFCECVDTCRTCDGVWCRNIFTMVDRLADYEDTGLTPKEIKEVQEALAPIPFGRFHDIMEAERAGRLVLPSDTNL